MRLVSLNQPYDGVIKIVLGIGALLLVVWVVNLTQLFSCDFEAPYECEISHSLGIVIPPAAIVTVWIDTDE